jgi:hypothetical protein
MPIDQTYWVRKRNTLLAQLARMRQRLDPLCRCGREIDRTGADICLACGERYCPECFERHTAEERPDETAWMAGREALEWEEIPPPREGWRP